MENKMENKMENLENKRNESEVRALPGQENKASRLSGRSSGANCVRTSDRFETYQPPVTRIQSRRMAENLIIKGHNLLRVEPVSSDASENDWVYVFAGTRARETADGIAGGKIALENSARTEAARRFATGMIRAAILEHRHRENLAQTYREVAELLPESPE
jgi:hypothetical protein